MFKVVKHKIGKFDAVRLINDHTGEYLEVLTEFGAGLNDLVIKNANDQLVSVIDGYRSGKEIINDHHSAFKGSKLSPFPNRVTEGRYVFEGTTYQLPINEVDANNNLHAFLHCRPFELVEESAGEYESSVRLVYEYKGTDQGYPFSYCLTLIYKFREDGAEMQTAITNTSASNIPIGDGWHPYFRFDNVNAVKMQMSGAERITSNFDNELLARHGFEEERTIEELQLDDCFEINGSDQFSVKLKDSTNEIEVWQESEDKKYKYVQIFTPPGRNSIAVEPVTCAPNAFNTGQGLIRLKPNEKVSMSFGIRNLLLNK